MTNELQNTIATGPEHGALFGRWSVFRRDEDGGLITFSLFIFVLMIMAGGMAVDFMRFEAHRSVLQSALDRAVLAAADIDQTLPPEEVVEDYFEKAMISATLTGVTVQSGIGSREVSATAELVNPSTFLRLMGITEITAPAASTAEERVPYTEVALVLDTSGSMAGSRIQSLQDAAITFTNLVIPEAQTDANDGLVVVSMVPYNMSVNMGGRFSSEFNLTNEHAYSYCAHFSDSAFSQLSMDPTASLQRHVHYDIRWQTNVGYPYYSAVSTYYEDNPYIAGNVLRLSLPLCHRAAEFGNDDTNPILPWRTEAGEIITAIEEFEAEGGTAIDDGVRWGLALLDPSLRSVAANYVTSADASDVITGFPLDYDVGTVSKVLVLMTDGQIDAQYYPRTELRSGATNVFYDPDTDRWSLLLRGANATRVAPSNQDDTQSDLWLHLGNFGDNTSVSVETYPDTAVGSAWTWTGTNNGGGDWNGLDRLSQQSLSNRMNLYQQRWSIFRQAYVRGYLSANEWAVYDRPIANQETTNAERATRMIELCNLAKAQDIVIYGIAMDSPNAEASQLMADCATSSSTFFDVAEADIEETFATIAGDVTALRLVQR